MRFSYNVTMFRALTFNSSYAFLKRPSSPSLFLRHTAMLLSFAGLEAITLGGRMSCGKTCSVKWINVIRQLSDGNVDTYDTFSGHSDQFTHLNVYIGEIMGPFDVYVINNYSCWPQMSLHIMILTSGGHIEYCIPRTEIIVPGNTFKVCPYYCGCTTCGNHIIIQLPTGIGGMISNLGVHEVLVR